MQPVLTRQIGSIYAIFTKGRVDISNLSAILDPRNPSDPSSVPKLTPKALNDLNPTIIITLNLSFSEFLPRVLGPEYVKIFGLSLRKDGYSNVYNNRCSPDIYNSFATAAFRFGHSLIKPMFSLVPSKRQAQPDEIRLRHHFNNPDIVFR